MDCMKDLTREDSLALEESILNAASQELLENSCHIEEIIKPNEEITKFHEWVDNKEHTGILKISINEKEYFLAFIDWQENGNYYIVIFDKKHIDTLAEIHSINEKNEFVWKYQPTKRDHKNDLRKQKFISYYGSNKISICMPTNIYEVKNFINELLKLVEIRQEADNIEKVGSHESFPPRQAIISSEEYSQELEEQIKKSRNMSKTKRDRLLDSASKKPEQIQTITTTYKRNSDVIVAVLERAKGICERCHKPAPFYRASDSTPYLEVHHVIPLSEGGDDTVDNAKALCPNCHREVHFGKK